MSDMNETITHINNMLNHLPSTPSDRILLRVPNHLRSVKEEAFEPHIISIGPYHRGKDHLAAMEEHKVRYLKLLLQRRGESSVAKYVAALSKLNEKAKSSYEEQFLEKRRERSLEERRPDDFLKTMLVDACFIVELIRKGVAKIVRIEDDDPIFKSEMTTYSLLHDLLLLENQLPFFILEELFDMTLLPNEESNLVDTIFRFFEMRLVPGYKRREQNQLQKATVPHLLGLIHDNWLNSQGVDTCSNMTDQEKQRTEAGIQLCIDCGSICKKKARYDAEVYIRCATELHEAGIKFKRAEAEECSIFDIKFENGVLKIPNLTIHDRGVSLLRNLIAYEQLWIDNTYVIEYVKFMDCLINSNKDVELLRRNGIIDSWMGDDEVIAKMFNRLLDNVIVPRRRYIKVCVQVNEYCDRKWNLWKAKLKHDYFNSPWALISFLAAVFLMLVTVLQTVYSVLSYYP